MNKMNKYKVYVAGFDTIEIESSFYRFEDGKLIFEDIVGELVNQSISRYPIIKKKAIFNQWSYIEIL